MARSLLDDSRFDSIGRRAAAPRPGAGRERAKAAVAAALLVVAGGILSWNMGLFAGGSRAHPQVLTVGDVDNLNTQNAARQADIDRGIVQVGSD